MEKIIVHCPNCEKKYALPPGAQKAGTHVKLKCRGCSASFVFRPEPALDNPSSDSADATIFSGTFSGETGAGPYHFPDDCEISISFSVQNRVSRHRLTKRLTIIGRTEGEIKIQDPLMSRKHFSIEVKSSTVVELRDLASRNGTLHNGIKIYSVLLQSGDIIKAGSSEITFSNRINL